MKLLRKTSRRHLLLSAVLLLIAGILIFVLVNRIIEEELTEKLILNAERISKAIDEGDRIAQLPPILEVVERKAWVDSAMSIKDTLVFDPLEGEEEIFRQVRTLHESDGKIYRITVRQVLIEPMDTLATIGLSLAIVLVLLLVGLILVNNQVARRLWKPFYQNLEILNSYAVEEGQAISLHSSDIDEFEDLKQAIQDLTQRSLSAFSSLKEFSENAAHEIQTPLAVIRAKLELALQDPALSLSQAEYIQSSLSAVRRLSRLNRSLLLLTKLDNKQFTRTEAISLTKIIREKISQLKGLLSSKGLQITSSLEEGQVEADPSLLDILLSNLLGNAIKHNVNQGEIRIHLKDGMLRVSNTSEPLNVPAEKLFDRFTKASATSKSAGLGLAIAKKICELYHWEISYSTEGRMHSVTIRF